MKSIAKMTCGRFLDRIRQNSEYYEQLSRAILPRYLDGKFNLSILDDHWPNASDPLIRSDVAQEFVETLDLWLQAQIAVSGPKLFRPSLNQCLAMEQIAPRIPVVEYSQPFPVMIVEPPIGYHQLRARPCRHVPEVGDDAPEFVIMGLPPVNPPVLAVQVRFSSRIVVSMVVTAEHTTIEEPISREYGDEDEPYTSDERTVIGGAMRLGVNSMLMLMEYGCKAKGPASPQHYEKSQRNLKKVRERGGPTSQAERDLRMVAQTYDLAQHIVLHDEASSDHSHHDGHTDKHLRPHWRRGYWQRHACGPNRSERKRILIKPVLVNKHLLGDGAWHAKTSYSAK